MKQIICLILCSLQLISQATHAKQTEQTSLTIYSNATPGSIPTSMYRPTPHNTGWNNAAQIPGYAVIHQTHNVTLSHNRTLIKLNDVAAYIDPTTVSFASLTDPNHTTAIEQNFYFDLVNPHALSQRYIGKEISFETSFPQHPPLYTRGTLLSAHNNQLSIQKTDGTIISTEASTAIFPALPNGLYTKPTLVLDILAEQAGEHLIKTSYQTEGITWWADYNATYYNGKDENSGTLDLGAWVSIINKSGASYPNSHLKLVAGDVNKITPTTHRRHKSAPLMLEKSFAGNTTGFKEKSLFEFHLYNLGRPTNIIDNATKQLELFQQVAAIPTKKLFIYKGSSARYYGHINHDQNFGQTSNKKVNLYLTFKNNKETGLGIPLPAGRLRVNTYDEADTSLQFIGEDIIDHTPKDETIRIKLGNAFDLVGERKQTHFFIDHKRRYIKETIEVTVRNHKKAKVDVLIAENLSRGVQWKIEQASHTYTMLDAHSVHFPVTIPANNQANVHYTVTYTW